MRALATRVAPRLRAQAGWGGVVPLRPSPNARQFATARPTASRASPVPAPGPLPALQVSPWSGPDQPDAETMQRAFAKSGRGVGALGVRVWGGHAAQRCARPPCAPAHHHHSTRSFPIVKTVTFPPGHVLREHAHGRPVKRLGVAAGAFVIEVSATGQAARLGPGDWVDLPGGLLHSAWVEGDASVVLVMGDAAEGKEG